MFEALVAIKYLTPRWRQLSVSIISLISILVIALVVWLVVVFFSVTNGLEKSWIEKLIALTAPVRITPTDEYYQSYYYKVDSISALSDYNPKTIQEKLHAFVTDPYDPSMDEEIPYSWPQADREEGGQLKDLVKLTFQAAESLPGVPGLQAKDFEIASGTLNLQLVRREALPLNRSALGQYSNTATLTQASYLGSFDPDNSLLSKALSPLTSRDLNNVLQMNDSALENSSEDPLETVLTSPEHLIQARLKAFFSTVIVRELKVPNSLWSIPKSLLPKFATFQGYAIYKENQITRIVLHPKGLKNEEWVKSLEGSGYTVESVKLELRDGGPFLVKGGQDPQPLPKAVPIALAEGTLMKAKLEPSSLENASHSTDLIFTLNFMLQGTRIEGQSPLGKLLIHSFTASDNIRPDLNYSPLWIHHTTLANGESLLTLPLDRLYGDGVLLPRSFRDAGTAVGDRGYLSYATPSISSMQEQQIPIFVAGFYEPGVIPLGGKCILVSQQVTSLIRSSYLQDNNSLTNGINIRFDKIEQADHVKASLQQAFTEAGIAPYWKIETYKEYDFTKDIIQQLHSEKNLFTLLATIIIAVACSNIISMLIILVNDKKLEIGIMRSMGASAPSIALIFGICGILMGIVGSMLGILAAILTLKNLQPLINVISRIQGHEMFNPLFFGDTLPTDLSFEALAFVVLVTALISLAAGLVPAIKACMMRPSAILRSE
jgi:lipoprotein-releasing system permease protein